MGRDSKKRKSSWRKNIDISDVEKFLEESREEERVEAIAEKVDPELFLKDDTKFSKLKLKETRKKKFQAVPKFCSSSELSSYGKGLKALSGVLVGKPNVKRHVYSSKQSKVFGKTIKALKTPKTDIWENQPTEKNEWLNDAVIKHNESLTGKPLVKSSIKVKNNAVPNVELPQPGASYNPTIDDYNELKQSVISKEREINKINSHYDRVITSKFTKMSKEDREVMVWNEMSEGLFDNEENQDSPDSQDDEEYKAINPPVANKKKNQKAKNKKRRAIVKRNNDTIVKTELKKCSDIGKIAKFESDLNSRDATIVRKRENRAKRLEEKQFKAPRVSYLKFEESEADFTEPAELTDTLRTVVPNKSLIVDRYKSFQKRALIAPKKHRDGILRNNKSHLKRWKRYTKSDHKENNE